MRAVGGMLHYNGYNDYKPSNYNTCIWSVGGSIINYKMILLNIPLVGPLSPVIIYNLGFQRETVHYKMGFITFIINGSNHMKNSSFEFYNFCYRSAIGVEK
jgi:hypothetical protein